MSKQQTLLDLLTSLIGQETQPTDWLEITQDRINQFADVTNDHQWIHVDVERANREVGGTIAHGLLTLSLFIGMLAQVSPPTGAKRTLNYGYNKIRFISPVPVGSRIRAHSKITEVGLKSGGISVTRVCTMEIKDHERPALVAEVIGVVFAD